MPETPVRKLVVHEGTVVLTGHPCIVFVNVIYKILCFCFSKGFIYPLVFQPVENKSLRKLGIEGVVLVMGIGEPGFLGNLSELLILKYASRYSTASV